MADLNKALIPSIARTRCICLKTFACVWTQKVFKLKEMPQSRDKKTPQGPVQGRMFFFFWTRNFRRFKGLGSVWESLGSRKCSLDNGFVVWPSRPLFFGSRMDKVPRAQWSWELDSIYRNKYCTCFFGAISEATTSLGTSIFVVYLSNLCISISTNFLLGKHHVCLLCSLCSLIPLVQRVENQK